MNIAEISERAYANAVAKGFHSNEDGTHKERNMGESLALIHSEITEAHEELERNRDHLHHYYREKDNKPEGFLVELADTVIRIGDLVGSLEAGFILARAIDNLEDFHLANSSEWDFKGGWTVDKHICFLHSSVSKALEEIRRNSDPLHRYADRDLKPSGFLIELANTIIGIKSLVKLLRAEPALNSAIEEKMAFNATRPHMHGKKF